MDVRENSVVFSYDFFEDCQSSKEFKKESHPLSLIVSCTIVIWISDIYT